MHPRRLERRGHPLRAALLLRPRPTSTSVAASPSCEVPYTDSEGRYPDLEYPVLIGYFAYGAAVVDPGACTGAPTSPPRHAAPAESVGGLPGVDQERQDFVAVNAVLLLALRCCSPRGFLAGAHPRPAVGRHGLRGRAGPGAHRAGQLGPARRWPAWPGPSGPGPAVGPLLVGVFIGLGAAAKLYPAFLLGALPRRRAAAPRAARLRLTAAAGASAAWLAVQPAGDARPPRGRGRASGASTPTAAPTSARSGWWPATTGGRPGSAPSTWSRGWSSPLVCLGVLVLGLRRAPPAAGRPAGVPRSCWASCWSTRSTRRSTSCGCCRWRSLARPRWRDLLIWQAGEVVYFVDGLALPRRLHRLGDDRRRRTRPTPPRSCCGSPPSSTWPRCRARRPAAVARPRGASRTRSRGTSEIVPEPVAHASTVRSNAVAVNRTWTPTSSPIAGHRRSGGQEEHRGLHVRRLGEQPLLAGHGEGRADEAGRVETALGHPRRAVTQGRPAGGRLQADPVGGAAGDHQDVAVAGALRPR